MNPTDNYEGPCLNASMSKTNRSRPSHKKGQLEFSYHSQNELPGATVPSPQVAYEKRYSILQRLYKLVISPSEAMKDIGLAPDYGGPVFVVILRMIVAVVAISIVFQKFQLVGDSQIVSEVWGVISLVLSIAVIISIFLYVAFWLLKSLLVKYLCDGETDWSFAAAASVTGYAYIADVITGIAILIATYELLPSLTLNVSNLDVARQQIADFRSQALGTELAVSIPIGLIGIVWKSYLGGLGAKFGTFEHCTLVRGFAVFFILALLGWLISFLTTGAV